MLLVQLMNPFRAVSLGSNVSQPYVGELGEKRAGIAADVVGVDKIGYEVEENDGPEADDGPSGEVEGAEGLKKGHWRNGECDGGGGGRRLRI